jgi:osmotically-inducible protein OsmY
MTKVRARSGSGLRLELATVIALGLFASGALAAASETEASLGQSIQARLLRYGGVDAAKLAVAVNGGIVTLSGNVTTLLAQSRAVVLAQAVPGVRGVIDLISVSTDARPDTDIASDVAASITVDPVLQQANIEVYCIEGTVTLGGIASSQAESYLAEISAKGTPGVREVNDDIGISPAGNRSDDRITADIDELLRWDAWLVDKSINVHVAQGQVSFSGSVDNDFERKRASDLAVLTGAVSIQNDLQVPSGGGATPALSDQTLATMVRDVLSRDPRLRGTIPRIATSKGTVVLSGTLSDYRTVDAVLADARTVPGVANVSNRMVVNSQNQPSDASLEQELRAALARDPHIPTDDITISVTHGRVTLRGVLMNASQRHDIRMILEKNSSVRGINDKLTLINYGE